MRKETDARRWLPLSAFLLCAAAMLATLACMGVAPFGPLTLITADMKNQYTAFHAYLRNALLSGSGLSYSFQAGLGSNMVPLIAYYLSSPLSLLVLLFPATAIADAMLCITVIKVGLCGMAYAVLARRVLHTQGRAALLFAPCYALCSFVMCYASNIMWLDALIILPIALTCAHSLVTKGRWLGLLCSLTLLFFSQFYIGYMAGIFTFLCFVCMLWVLRPSRWLRALLQFAGVTLLAAGLCAFMLLPTALRLLQNASVTPDYADTRLFPLLFSLPQLMTRAFFGAFDTLRGGGGAALYCGTLTLLLLPAYLLHPRIAWRERLCVGLLSALLLFSISSPAFSFFWHAFDIPAWFQYRFSFLLAVLWVWAAHRCWQHIDGVRMWVLTAGALLSLAFLLFGQSMQLPLVTGEGFSFAPWLVGGWFLLILIYRYAPKTRNLLGWLCIAIVLAETVGNGFFTMRAIHERNPYVEQAEQRDMLEERGALLAQLPWSEDEPFRTLYIDELQNDGLRLGYMGMQFFSSTADYKLGDYWLRLGLRSKGIIQQHFGSTLALDSLMGIRYYLDTQPPHEYTVPAASQGELQAYENPYVLPLAFAAPASLLDYEIEPPTYEFEGQGAPMVLLDPFVLQNRIFEALSGGEIPSIFVPLSQVEITHTGIQMSIRADGARHLQTTEDLEGRPAVTYTGVAAIDGPIYAFFSQSFESGRANIFYENRKVLELDPYATPIAAYVGDMYAEDTFDVSLELDSEALDLTQECLYSLDMEALGALSDLAYERMLTDLRWTDGAITGTVLAEADQVIFLSIPYDAGWQATVDGQPVLVERALDVWSAVPVSAGQHVLRMHYAPPGLITGVVISCVSLAVLAATILLSIVLRNAHRKR